MSTVSEKQRAIRDISERLPEVAHRAARPTVTRRLGRENLRSNRSAALSFFAGSFLLRGLLRLVDLVILLASVVLATMLCRYLGDLGPAQDQLPIEVLAFGAVLLVLKCTGANGSVRRDVLRARLEVVVSAMACGGLTAAISSTVLFNYRMSGLLLAIWLTVATTLAAIGVAASARPLQALSRHRRMIPRVAVIGTGAFSLDISRRMLAQTDSTTFLGLYNDGWEPATVTDAELPVLGGIDALIARARREHIDTVVLTMPMADMERIMRARAALASMTVDIFLATEATNLICRNGRIDRLGCTPMVKIASRPLGEWQVVQKAAFDWVLGSVLLVLFLPILMLVGVAVRLDSPGPALFRQKRRGYNYTTFEVLKFRTMYTHQADANADQQTTQDDPRVTRLGRLLRRTSLDELPQLINVMRGEMSLVGPRPHAINTKADGRLFADVVADYNLRYRIKPGITGWAQVNGWRGETRTCTQIEGRVAHDLYYIDNWSLAFDFRILVLTALRELNSKVAF